MTTDQVLFKAEKINKYFGPTHANADLDFMLQRGEVRGIIGENGSGKSTFISIISGMQRKDSGTMHINGQPYNPKSPIDAINSRIGTVVQELGLVDGLTAGVNIFLGRTHLFSKKGVIDLHSLYNEAKGQMEKWNLANIPLNKPAGSLSVEERKIIELVRALSNDPDILILDEITNALSHDNRAHLFNIIKTLKSQGKSVIVISHDLEEVIDITDSITIMRDGFVSGNVNSKEIELYDLKRLMVGREIKGEYYREDNTENFRDEIVLRADNLSKKDMFSDITFELHKGEILGVCGLSGAGIHELGKALFGLIQTDSGAVILTKKNIKINNPMDSMKNGVAYVPKDRDKEALMLSATIEDNICLPSTRDVQGMLGFLSPKKRERLAEKAVADYEIKATGILQFISGLSGGNRQKVNLARWMTRGTSIFILDCPTRGVDIGVKAYIYDIMKKTVELGNSIIMISDELQEAIGMSDRILVLKNGKLVSTMCRSSNFSEESIIEVMV